MPRMIITKANKYYTKFKISPSKKLQKDLNDWPKRIVNKVTDFKEGVDYEVKYTVDRKHFQTICSPKSSRTKRRLQLNFLKFLLIFLK